MIEGARPTLRQEVHLVREVLEGALPPEVATAAMFAALHNWKEGMPRDAADVLELCRGPLSEILIKRVGEETKEEVIRRLEQVLLSGDRTGTDIPLDVDIDLEGMEGEPSITMIMPIVWREPVSVLVVSAKDTFAARLEASLGATRVHASTIGDAGGLRRAMFSESPLLVLVDATNPSVRDPAELGVAICDLPDNVLCVIWDRASDYGHALEVVLDATSVEPVGLRKDEGISPLLDLVLSRYKV